MKKRLSFLLFLACIWKVQAQDVNARLEVARNPVVVTGPLITITTISEAEMLANTQFRRMAGKEWKLDQMYVDSVPVPRSQFANIKLAFVYPNQFVWISTVNGQEQGKDYPVKFWFKNVLGKEPEINRMQLYHKYRPEELMYTYIVSFLSDKILVLTSSEKESQDAGITHAVEYRFLALPQ